MNDCLSSGKTVHSECGPLTIERSKSHLRILAIWVNSDQKPSAQHGDSSEHDSSSATHACSRRDSSRTYEMTQTHHRYKKTISQSEARQLNGDVLIKDARLSPKHFYEDTRALDRADQINGNIGDRDAFNSFFYTRVGEIDKKIEEVK